MPSSTKKSGSPHFIFSVNNSSAANDPDNMKYIIGGAFAGGGLIVIIACIVMIAKRKDWQSGTRLEKGINIGMRASPVSNITTQTALTQTTDESGLTPTEKKDLGFPSTEPQPIPKTSNSRQGKTNAPKKLHKISVYYNL